MQSLTLSALKNGVASVARMLSMMMNVSSESCLAVNITVTGHGGL
jgi:hypothetical protein